MDEGDVPPPDYPDFAAPRSDDQAALQSNAVAAPGAPLPSNVEVDLADAFFDIAPSTDSTSFQVGYLGVPGFRAWIRGDVLVKLDEATRASRRFMKW